MLPSTVVARTELAQPGLGIGVVTEREGRVPGQDTEPTEARQIADDVLRQRCREADQGLVLGKIPERQDRHKRLAVRGHIAAAQNPGGVERLRGRAPAGLAHGPGELLDVGTRLDLEIPRQAGAKLAIAPAPRALARPASDAAA